MITIITENTTTDHIIIRQMIILGFLHDGHCRYLEGFEGLSFGLMYWIV